MGKNVIGGATDVQVTVKIVDDTSGQPETGVVYNTTGIDLWYRREGSSYVHITEATLGALTTAHTDGGFLHINDGVYRLDVPDAAFAAGVASVYIGGTVPDMVVLGTEIHLDAVADQVWDAVRTGHSVSGSFGYALVNSNKTTTQIEDAVWDGVRTSHAVGGTFGQALMNSVLSQSVLADAVWDEATSGHTTGGSYGLAVADIDTSTANATPTAATIADAVWDELKSAHTIADSFGDYLDDEISSRSDFDETANPVELLNSGGSAGTSAAELVVDMAVPTTAAINAEVDTALADAKAGYVDAIWDEATSGHSTGGTYGLAVADVDTATGLITLAAINAEVDTAIADAEAGLVDAIWDENVVSAHNTANTAGKLLSDIDTATANATPTAATTAAAVWNALKSAHTTPDTFGDYLDDEISSRSDFDETANPVELLNSGGSAGTSAAELVVDMAVPTTAAINAEVDTALADAKAGYVDAIWDEATSGHSSGGTYGLAVSDIDTSTANATPTAATIADAVWDEVQSGHTTSGTFGLYLDQTVSTGGGGASASVIADAVWNEATSGHVSAGSFGLAVGDTDTATGLITLAAINTEVDTAIADAEAGLVDAIWDENVVSAHDTADTAGKLLEDTAATVATNLNAQVSGIDTTTIPTVAQIADGVWDELQAGHTTTDTFGEYLDSIISDIATGTPPSAAAVADAVWNEATSGHSSAGTYGLAVADVDTSTANATPTAATIAALVWDQLKSAHTIADSFGDYLDDEISSRPDAAAVNAQVDTAIADALDAIADAVWDEEVVTAHNTANTAGLLLEDTAATVSTNLDAQVSTRSDFDETTDPVELLDSGGSAGTSAAELVVDMAVPTAATTAALVWDQLKSAHTTPDTFGDYLDDEISSRSDFNEATDPVELLDSGGSAGTSAAELVVDMAVPNAAAINAEVDTALADAKAGYVDAVWNEDVVVAHNTSDTAGKILSDLTEAHIIRRSTATAGASTTITLDGSAVATDDYYNSQLITLVSGTGIGQSRTITDYIGSSKLATVTPAWATDPDATSVFIVSPAGSTPIELDSVDTSAIADAVWNEAASGHTVAGTFGKYMDTFSTNIDATISSRSDFDETTDPVELLDSGGGIGTSAAELVVDMSVPNAAAINAEVDTAIADALNSIADAVWDEDIVAAHNTSDTAGKAISDIDTATTNATPTSAAIADAVWDEVQSGHTTGGTFGLYIDAIVSGANTTTPPTANAIADQVWNEATSGHSSAGTYGLAVADIDTSTANATPTAATIADAVWDELKSAHTIADSFGDYLDDEITSRSTFDPTATGVELLNSGGSAGTSAAELVVDMAVPTTAAINAEVDTAIADAEAGLVDAIWDENVVSAHNTADTAGKAISDIDTATANATPTAATIADAVWDEVQSGHTTGGTFGLYLDAIVSAIDTTTTPTVAQIADGVWDEAASGHVTSGTTGEFLRDGHDALVVRRNTAQTGAAGTITFDASASATNDLYNDSLIVTVGGTGAGQARTITDYVGSSKVADITPNWITTPDATTVFLIIPSGSTPVEIDLTADTVAIATAVWDRAASGHTSVGSFGKLMDTFSTNIDATISSRSDFDETSDPVELLDSGGSAGTSAAELVVDMAVPTTAAINAEVDTALADAKAGYVDAIWDEPASGHTTTGTFGDYLDAEVSDITLTAAAVADAVFDELITDHTTTDTFGWVIAEIKEKTDLITTGNVTVTTPVTSTNAIVLVQGDEYANADSRALSFSSTGWPDLTASTVTLTASEVRGTGTMVVVGTLSSVGGATQTIYFEPTAVQTALLSLGQDAYKFGIQAVLQTSENRVTLVTSYITVNEDQ